MSKVFIAAGHFPERPGAGYEDFYEHDEAVRWVHAIVAHEPTTHAFVKVPDGTLKRKVDFINFRAKPGDVAIEIHFNSFVDANGRNRGDGCVTLFYPGKIRGAEPADEEGRRLAGACQDVLSAHFPPDRGVAEGWYRGDPERGAYYFLERTRCPSVIIEPEFVHHYEIIQARRAACCVGLACALAQYVG